MPGLTTPASAEPEQANVTISQDALSNITSITRDAEEVDTDEEIANAENVLKFALYFYTQVGSNPLC